MPPPCHAINAQGRPNSRDELRQQSRPRLLGGAAPSRGRYRAGSWLRDDVGNPGIPRQASSWALRRKANGLPTVYRQDRVVTGGADMRPPSPGLTRGNVPACWLMSSSIPGQTNVRPIHPLDFGSDASFLFTGGKPPCVLCTMAKRRWRTSVLLTPTPLTALHQCASQSTIHRQLR